MRLISSGIISIEKAWFKLDKYGHFGSLQTFRVYIKALDKQIDQILSLLQRLLVINKSDSLSHDVFPDQKCLRSKVTLLSRLLDELIESLHKKGLDRHFLESEYASFLNFILFHEEKMILLRNTS